MNRRILTGGLALGAFLVTLAFVSWHEDLWRPATDPAPSVAVQPSRNPVAPVPVAAPPVAAETATSAPTDAAPLPATTPAPAPPPDNAPADSAYDQNINPGVDPEAMRRDRGVQHRSGSH